MKITTETIKKKYFTCEGCGTTWQEKMWITKCPKHGEFCIGCAKTHEDHSISKSENEMILVYIVCPDCDFEMDKDTQTIVHPYVEIKKDFAGIWIGSIST